MEAENTRKSTRNYQENICSVCHTQFSMTNRPTVCSKCFQKTCRLHIYTEKTQTVCEICVRIDLRKSIVQKTQGQLNTLKNELRSLQHREKANLKEISIKSELIETLDNSLAVQKADFNAKTEEVEAMIDAEVKATKENSLKVSEMKAEVEICKKNTKVKHEAWVAATGDLIKVQNYLTTVQTEHDLLYKKYKKLAQDNSKMVTFQKVRTLTCNKCYEEVVVKYKEDIIRILSRKEKKSQLIPSILAINFVNSDLVHNSSCKCIVV